MQAFFMLWFLKNDNSSLSVKTINNRTFKHLNHRTSEHLNVY
jgi:hypothetical protein